MKIISMIPTMFITIMNKWKGHLRWLLRGTLEELIFSNFLKKIEIVIDMEYYIVWQQIYYQINIFRNK